MLALLQRYFAEHTFLNIDFIAGNVFGSVTTWLWMRWQLKGKPNETVGKDERI